MPSGQSAYGQANAIGLESMHLFKVYYGKYSPCQRKPFIWKSACLVPFFPSFCFLNFTLKNQFAQAISISPHLSLWLSFSKAMRALFFPQGQYTNRFISACQLLWGHQWWRVHAHPRAPRKSPSLHCKYTQCPSKMTTELLVCFTAQPQGRVWSLCFQAASYQSVAERQLKANPLFWKGPWWYRCHVGEFHL